MKLSLLFLGLVLFPVFAMSAEKPVYICNGGILTVAPDEGGRPYFIATLRDRAAVDWLIEKSEETITTKDSNGRSLTRVAGFPNGVEIVDANGERILKLNYLHALSTDGYGTGGPGGVVLEPYGSGLNVTLENGEMTSSHSMATWTVGSWWFDSCHSL